MPNHSWFEGAHLIERRKLDASSRFLDILQHLGLGSSWSVTYKENKPNMRKPARASHFKCGGLSKANAVCSPSPLSGLSSQLFSEVTCRRKRLFNNYSGYCHMILNSFQPFRLSGCYHVVYSVSRLYFTHRYAWKRTNSSIYLSALYYSVGKVIRRYCNK